MAGGGFVTELPLIVDERWLYQLEGHATVTDLDTRTRTVLGPGDCCVIDHEKKVSVLRSYTLSFIFNLEHRILN